MDALELAELCPSSATKDASRVLQVSAMPCAGGHKNGRKLLRRTDGDVELAREEDELPLDGTSKRGNGINDLPFRCER